MKAKSPSPQRPAGSGAALLSARNCLRVIVSTILFVVCHQVGLILRVNREGIQNSIGLLGSLANSMGSLAKAQSLSVIGEGNNGLQNGGLRPSSSGRTRRLESTEPLPESTEPLPLVTALILTYSKPKGLEVLLRTLMGQTARFELVVVDNGCKPETKRVYREAYASRGNVAFKFLPLCNNPGYAVGNNKGAELASQDSKYILFLNDDLQLSSPDFIEKMILLAEAKPNAAAVGCKIVNLEGNALIEAGSIIFKGADTMGYARGLKGDDIFRSDVSYPRPVDFVSGACLLIEKDVFMGYKHGNGFGFDNERFPNYYEDTDLQMHIQHDIQKEVWLQPKAIGKHEEHGSFGASDSVKLMQKAAIIFQDKWESAMEKYHVPHPIINGLKGREMEMRYLLAADTRARKTSVANILYIDSHAPRKTRWGSGRSFDNLSMITELGHRITLVTNSPEGDEKVIGEITDLGVEYYEEDLDSLVSARAGFYDVVIISRPDTLNMVRANVKSMYLKHPFTLVYDAEALSFHSDELRMKAMTVDGIRFPEEHELGRADKNPLWEVGENYLWKLKQYREISLVQTGDVIIAVSDQESKAMFEILPYGKSVHTIGHAMDPSSAARQRFRDRRGILFVGDFRDRTNVDAIWYFLTEVYPLVVETAEVPIPLKIVGSEIPQRLRDTVNMIKIISRHVTFHESPNSIDRFLGESCVLVAPHLYGAGLQYQVLEALSSGLPVVMSRFTFDNFGKIPGCVGSEADSMKQCIIDVHEDEGTWASLQNQGFDFIKKHDREEVMKEWSKVIDGSLALAWDRNRAFVAAEYAYGQAYPTLLRRRKDDDSGFQSFLEHYILDGKEEGKTYSFASEIWNGLTDDKFEIKEPTEQCEEGECIYLRMYPDVATNWKGTAFAHYKRIGKNQGRKYVCTSVLSDYFETKDPTDKCPEGEILYFGKAPDVMKKWGDSAFNHWQMHGKKEGRSYSCLTKIHDIDLDWSVKREKEQMEARIIREGLTRGTIPTKKCPEGESIYVKMYPNVATSITKGHIKSAFAHWAKAGKSEGRRYFCDPDTKSEGSDDRKDSPKIILKKMRQAIQALEAEVNID